MSWTTDLQRARRQYRPALLVIEAPTLHAGAGDVAARAELWAVFTGRRDAGDIMDGRELTELAGRLDLRARRAIRAAGLVTIRPADARTSGPYAELCRKLISDELRSEWLRMHSGRRPKRAELRLLALLFDQLDAAVQAAIAQTSPADMPAAAGRAVAAHAVARRR